MLHCEQFPSKKDQNNHGSECRSTKSFKYIAKKKEKQQLGDYISQCPFLVSHLTSNCTAQFMYTLIFSDRCPIHSNETKQIAFLLKFIT